MSARSHRSSSVYSGDMDNISTTSSQWTTTYRKLPKKQPLSIRFLSWAAGAPRGAHVVKKKVRDTPDDRSTHSSWSSGSYFSEPDTQLYWVTSSDDRYYYSGSSSSGRSSRGRKRGGSRPKHFNGSFPPMQPPPGGPGFDGPMDDHFGTPGNGHFSPPPPADMGGHFGAPAGFHPPPPPPPPVGQPAPGGPAPFINLTGQNHPGMNRGPPLNAGHHMQPGVEDDWDDDSDSE